MLVSEAPFEFDTCSSGDLTRTKGISNDVTPKRVALKNPDVHLQVHGYPDLFFV